MFRSLIIFSCLAVVGLGLEQEPECPPNEVINACPPAICRNQQCELKGLPAACASVSSCEPGCICEDGYLRALNNSCIPEDQCDTPNCPPNEFLDRCAGALCTNQLCSERGQPQPRECPKVTSCEPGCICLFGYLRASNGSCVPEQLCDQ